MHAHLSAASIALALTVVALGLTNESSLAADNTKTEPGAEWCSQVGQWLDVRRGHHVSMKSVAEKAAEQGIALLGETHDNVGHHRWQLHTLAALHGHSKKLVLGFEMFPRRFQPELDRWVTGQLSEDAFLKAVNWRKTWGYEADLYLPLFHFARMHRIPMIALNVDRSLVSKVGAEGWEAIPADAREGLSDPAEASSEYKRSLARVYASKLALMNGDRTASSVAIEEVLPRPAFTRFVAAQLTWDRAMAEALSGAKAQAPDALVVGVMGSGHLSYFHGVPHQLKDLGHKDAAVLIPVAAKTACGLLGTQYADAIFTVSQMAGNQNGPKRQRLGVQVRSQAGAVRVEHVAPDSIAERAKMQKGDRIVQAAGVNITDSKGLISVLSRQSPGTWLPLQVERSGIELELIAKFPAVEEQLQ